MIVQKRISNSGGASAASVVIIGSADDLTEAVRGALEDAGIAAVSAGTGDLPSDADAVLVLMDHDEVAHLVGGRDSWRRRRANRVREGDVCREVTEVLLGIGGRRLLVLCDARRASPSQRSALIHWVRQVAMRIQYECSINGLDHVSVSYEVVVDDGEVQRIADSVVRWHGGVIPGTSNPVAPR